MTPELHRPVALQRVGPDGIDVSVEASPAECAALAGRFALPAIRSLRCRFALKPGPAGTVEGQGRLEATVVQTCVASLEDFDATIDEAFVLRFVPEGTESDDPDPDSVDEVAYAGGVLDLGETATEQLALALDPYPRRPDAVLPDTGDEPPERPFAKLASWRRTH